MTSCGCLTGMILTLIFLEFSITIASQIKYLIKCLNNLNLIQKPPIDVNFCNEIEPMYSKLQLTKLEHLKSFSSTTHLKASIVAFADSTEHKQTTYHNSI